MQRRDACFSANGVKGEHEYNTRQPQYSPLNNNNNSSSSSNNNDNQSPSLPSHLTGHLFFSSLSFPSYYLSFSHFQLFIPLPLSANIPTRQMCQSAQLAVLFNRKSSTFHSRGSHWPIVAPLATYLNVSKWPRDRDQDQDLDQEEREGGI